jgi:hypothetical protein
MRQADDKRHTAAFLVAALALAGCLAAGCGGASSAFQFLLGNPYPFVGGTDDGTTAPGVTGRQTGTTTGTTTTGFTDPCSEPQNRKFVRISMRNQSSDYVHYFLVLIAYVNSDEYPEGAVCETDRALYTSFGYTSIAAGQSVAFGNYCVVGPALYYFHRNGQFQLAGGATGRRLASAIGPAQGATPTYDAFFTSSGATVPVPDLILFHNPGSGQGQALKISRNVSDPCAGEIVVGGDPACQQDAFYYVDETDRLAGSTALGVGSGRRVPGDIQGTGCECLGVSVPFQILAPSGQRAQGAACNTFFRGGRIDYVFLREDTDPPFPQLVWRVTDATGARAHDFDPRSDISQ